MNEWDIEGVKTCIDKCSHMDTTELIILKKKAREQIKLLLAEYPSLEWTAALIGRKTKLKVEGEDEKEVFAVDELKVFDQEVSGASVKLTTKGDVDYAKTPNVIGWIHSHNTMGAFHSGVDTETAQQEEISLTVNNKMEYACKVKKELPCKEHTFVKGEILFEQDQIPAESLAWLEDAKSLIKEHTWDFKEKNKNFFKKRGKNHSVSSADNDTKPDYCGACKKVIHQNQSQVFCKKCDSWVHKQCYDFNTGFCDTCSTNNDTTRIGYI